MGQMQWRDPNGGNGTKILHVRILESEPWKPYAAFLHLTRAEHQPPLAADGLFKTPIRFSKGWATSQALLKLGFKYVQSEPLVDDETFNTEQVLDNYQQDASSV